MELNNNNKSTNVMACFQSGSIGHQFAISIVLLSIVLLSPGHALPRPAPIVGALSAPTQLLLSELLAAEHAPAEDSVYYSEQLVSTLRTLLASASLSTVYCLYAQKYPQQLLHHNLQQQAKQVSSFNHFVNKWPSLRDLLLTADYDDESALPAAAAEESVERERVQLGSHLLARLHGLAEPAADDVHLNGIDGVDDIMAAMPSKKQSEGLRINTAPKQHNIKKNVQCKHR